MKCLLYKTNTHDIDPRDSSEESNLVCSGSEEDSERLLFLFYRDFKEMYTSSSHVLQASKFPVIKSMGSVDSSRKFRNNIIISYLAFQMPTMYSTSMPETI